MKGEDFLQNLSGIDEKYILEASPDAPKGRKSSAVTRWAALAACAAVVAGTAFGLRGHLTRPTLPPEPPLEDVTPGGNEDPVTQPPEPSAGNPEDPDTGGTEKPDTGGPDTTVPEGPGAADRPATDPGPQAPPEPVCTAEELAMLFSGDQRNDGLPTKAYTQVFVPEEKYLYCPGELPLIVPLYEVNPALKPDGETLRELTESAGARLASAAGLDLSRARRMDTSDSGGLSTVYEDGELTLLTFQDGWSETLTLYSTSDTGALSVGGIPVEADQRLEDGEILRALEPLRDELFALLGVEFSDARVERRYFEWSEYGAARLYVYYYDESPEAVVPDGSAAPAGDYVMLDFDNIENWDGDNVSTGVLSDATVRYVRTRGEGKYRAVDHVPTVGLERAEDWLMKGWVFGGHSCPLCAAEQDAVSFEGYDAVSLVYVAGGEGESEALMPFYAFFKAIRETENGAVYAKTYVPAVEISGLQEFFESQEAYHNSFPGELPPQE